MFLLLPERHGPNKALARLSGVQDCDFGVVATYVMLLNSCGTNTGGQCPL